MGVLRGGPSDEYEISLKTGAAVLKHLGNLSEKYIATDIFIDKEGAWHISGRQVSPADAITQVDVIFNALHGFYGEDGKVQHILDIFAIPYTGSSALASAIGMNKMLTKKAFLAQGIPTPRYEVIEGSEMRGNGARDSIDAGILLKHFKSFSLPFIVKPVASGSSVGVSMVKGFHEFEAAVMNAFKYGDAVLVEEYIDGMEATCGLIDAFRDAQTYALPPIEIKQTKEGFFGDAGGMLEIVPGNFSHEVKDEIIRLAQLAHEGLGLRHYSRVDFIVKSSKPLKIYALEVNTLPGLTEESLVPKALEAVGVPLSQFIDHVLGLALMSK